MNTILWVVGVFVALVILRVLFRIAWVHEFKTVPWAGR